MGVEQKTYTILKCDQKDCKSETTIEDSSWAKGWSYVSVLDSGMTFDEFYGAQIAGLDDEDGGHMWWIENETLLCPQCSVEYFVRIYNGRKQAAKFVYGKEK